MPLVLISGYITDDLRESAMREGLRALVYKPNTVDELCQSIHELLCADSAKT